MHTMYKRSSDSVEYYRRAASDSWATEDLRVPAYPFYAVCSVYQTNCKLCYPQVLSIVTINVIISEEEKIIIYCISTLSWDIRMNTYLQKQPDN